MASFFLFMAVTERNCLCNFLQNNGILQRQNGNGRTECSNPGNCRHCGWNGGKCLFVFCCFAGRATRC